MPDTLRQERNLLSKVFGLRTSIREQKHVYPKLLRDSKDHCRERDCVDIMTMSTLVDFCYSDETAINQGEFQLLANDLEGNGSTQTTKFPKESTIDLPPEYDICNTEVTRITLAEAAALEARTADQCQCQEWFVARSTRLTASNFHRIVRRKKEVNDAFLKSLFDPAPFFNKFTQYGKKSEAPALDRYLERNTRAHFHPCGFVVNPKFSFLGATPDGKVCEEDICGILEIKCPYNARGMSIEEACAASPDFHLVKVHGGGFQLKAMHRFNDQVQGQLMLTGADWCDLVTYTQKDLHIQRIYPDTKVHKSMLNKLSEFYKEHAIGYLKAKKA
ncbi:hypothetical protein CAPTEDRAFT_200235 [Capitella teleta]|uniref:YqaJ viral recombinase domain-containing protein n=1 Tax=Capitella teleta TaxID=283909 RepID=R7V392_CAPTE|nr:hypothetical protein CAPTEDRAFT_200235 [Capitella teleta]|eukprot:ELU10796.1 hypothetical protein CAPTEDRAFT_200235 [Capitella teleta]